MLRHDGEYLRLIISSVVQHVEQLGLHIIAGLIQYNHFRKDFGTVFLKVYVI